MIELHDFYGSEKSVIKDDIDFAKIWGKSFSSDRYENTPPPRIN